MTEGTQTNVLLHNCDYQKEITEHTFPSCLKNANILAFYKEKIMQGLKTVVPSVTSAKIVIQVFKSSLSKI